MNDYEEIIVTRYLVIGLTIWFAFKWKDLGHDVRLFLTLFFSPLSWLIPAQLFHLEGVWLWGWIALGVPVWIWACNRVASSD
jgi:hypothetical protein